MDKAFTLGIGISMVLLPALSLTSVTFDWDYGDPDALANGIAPNGYWIQLYLTLYEIEMIDCLAVTDATFLITIAGVFLYNVYLVNRKDDPRSTDFYGWKNDSIFCCCKYCYECIGATVCFSLSIIFVMILFEFAESGFFSIYDNVNAGLLCMWAFIVKIMIGLRWIDVARAKNYPIWKRTFEIKGRGKGTDKNEEQRYDMAPLQDSEQDLEKGDNL